MSMHKQIIHFLKKYNIVFDSIDPLVQDASARRYFRVKNDFNSHILMNVSHEQFNLECFVKILNYLKRHNLSVPDITVSDKQQGLILMTDFGNATYKNILDNQSRTDDTPCENIMYERAIDVLIYLHTKCKPIELPKYTDEMLIEESLLFLTWYVSVLNGEKVTDDDRDNLRQIFASLFKYLELFPQTIVLKDYHAENIFWLEDYFGIKKVGLIDFQDAVIGCPIYDIVSLLEDARRDVSEQALFASINRYLRAFPQYTRKDFAAAYAILGVQRNLKIIGQFTRLAVRDKRTNYLAMLPRLWGYVHNSLKHPLLFPLRSWLEEVVPSQMKKPKQFDFNKINA